MNSFKEYINRNWEFDGLSAKCLYGVHTRNYQQDYYPLDPDDLCRCIQALRFMFGEGLNEKLRLIETTGKYHQSEIWTRFAQNWVKLLDLFETEWNTGSAPKTYALMRNIINNRDLQNSKNLGDGKHE